MNDLKGNKYLLKKNSYLIDLEKVDFITWKENDNEEGTYWTKLHIGSKEARYVCENLSQLRELVMAWCEIRGQYLSVEESDLIQEW
tara:strand:+ start:3779 stop:4036 length:258 start_codon:yes stop_codon:yes gene_type:complete